MSKKKPVISQPLNFRHEGHIGPANNQHKSQSTRGSVQQNLSPTALPQPCPGPSIIQNIGTQTLDKSTIEQLTSHIKDAVKQELMPLIETIEEAISNTCTARHKDSPYSNAVRNSLTEHAGAHEAIKDFSSLPVQTSSQQTESDEGLRIANPTYVMKYENVTSQRSFKKRPVPAPRLQAGMYRTLPGRTRSKTTTNQRDCYAMALKTHIEDIVMNCIFDISHLPDVLISGECLTEDECRTIREKVDRKDQIRILVAVIRTRDLAILEKFFAFLGQHNPSLKQKIEETAEKYKEDGFRERKCLICKVKSHVSVKYVADRLWAEGYIQDDVYNQIIYSEKPVGAQNRLWEEVLDSLARGEQSRRAFSVLERILRGKGHYEYLADGIKRILERHGKENLECECQLHIRFSKILSVSSVNSNAPSSSDSSIAASSSEILSDEISRKSADLHDGSFQKRKESSLTKTDECEEGGTEDPSCGTRDVKTFVRDTVDQPPPLPKKKSTVLEETILERSTEESSYV